LSAQTQNKEQVITRYSDDIKSFIGRNKLHDAVSKALDLGQEILDQNFENDIILISRRIYHTEQRTSRINNQDIEIAFNGIAEDFLNALMSLS